MSSLQRQSLNSKASSCICYTVKAFKASFIGKYGNTNDAVFISLSEVGIVTSEPKRKKQVTLPKTIAIVLSINSLYIILSLYVQKWKNLITVL